MVFTVTMRQIQDGFGKRDTTVNSLLNCTLHVLDLAVVNFLFYLQPSNIGLQLYSFGLNGHREN